MDPIIAGERLRAPWAASVAGLAFAVLFTVALVLMRTQPIFSMTDAELATWFETGQDLPALIGALYLAPFAGIAFLWFIAVIRDQLGDREDKFFGTVFFGSGLLFVAMFFAAVAVVASMEVGVRYLGEAPPSASTLQLIRALSYTLLFAFATRAAAVFLIATASLGRKTGAFPRWFAALGYVIGITLLIFVTFFDWSVLLLPAWVAIVSVFILRRERARMRERRSPSRSGVS